MHLAIPPPPVRNPEKGFKTRPKKTRTESVSTTETESVQTSSERSPKRSFRRSIINGNSYMGHLSSCAYSIIAFAARTWPRKLRYWPNQYGLWLICFICYIPGLSLYPIALSMLRLFHLFLFRPAAIMFVHIWTTIFSISNKIYIP